MRAIKLTLILLSAAGFCEFIHAGSVPADQEIAFWQQRIERDPEDLVSPVKLSCAFLRKARESGNAGHYTKAADLAQRVLDKDPKNFGAHINLAQACIALHRFKEALRLATSASAIDRTKPDAYAILCDAQFAMGDVEGAEKSCAKLFEISPRVSAHLRRANIHSIKGENSKALDDLNTALEFGEDSNLGAEIIVSIRLQIGGIHFSLGALDKAEEQFSAAVRESPESIAALDRISELRAAQGRYDEALALYNEALKRTPENAHLFQALGDICTLMEKPNDAKAWHEKALAIYKKSIEQGDVHYLRHLAVYYLEHNENLPEALALARRDLENRQDVFAYDLLAWALYRNGDFKAAAEAIRKALALGTQDAHLFHHAGMIFSRSGEFAKGQEMIRKAFALNPHFQKFHAHR